jgi:Cu+-exporting ATPase
MGKQTVFDVNGMKCGGCVAKAQDALKTVPGLVDAKVDLAGKSALVTGDVDPAAVIAALQKVGYPANVKSA